MSVRAWGTGSRLALAAVILAAAGAIAAAVDAWRLDPLPRPADRARPARRAASVSHRERTGLETLVLAAVARDPFRPDRRRPRTRYRLPSERLPAARHAPVPPIVSRLRLLGTAVLEGGRGIAAFQLSGGPPRVVRVGDTLEGLRLDEVGRGRAVLSTPDTAFVFETSGPSTGRRTP